nr:DUF4491 family protein [Sedimentibacter sp.]
MNFNGIIIGFITFLIIGILHPIVIKAEYYLGVKSWPIFLITGSLCIYISFLLESLIASSILSVLGFSLLWSIHELFQQEKRVEKGWFPKNPKKKNHKIDAFNK